MYQSSSDGMRKMDKMVLCLLFLCVNLFTFNVANPGYEDTDDDNGGHSSEFRPMGYEWNIAELEYGHDMLNKIYSLSKKGSAFPIGIRAIGKKGEKVEFDAEFYKFYKALPEVLKTSKRFERQRYYWSCDWKDQEFVITVGEDGKRRNNGLSQNNGHCRRPSYFSNH